MTQAATSWQEIDGALVTTIDAPSFACARRCVEAIADVAELMDHHPDIVWSYRHLEVRCSTHTTASVTELDHRLVAAIDVALEPLLAR